MTQMTDPAGEVRARRFRNQSWFRNPRGASRGVGAQAEQAARDAAMHTSPAIRALARAGYAAKGVVYALVGGLALYAAFTSGGQVSGSRGALRWLIGQPFGQALLAVVGIGLAGYALWCFVRAIVDPEDEGTDLKGWASRAFQFGKGVVHASLVLAVVGMLRGTAGGDGGSDGIDKWTARLMSFPLGIWLVGAAGLFVIGYGARQLYKAWTTDLDDQLSFGRMGPTAARWTIRFSRFGMAARGVVFGVVGTFLVVAAMRSNPAEAKGMGGALQALQQQPYGPVLLGVVAVGLISYGMYELIRARYRRIETT